MLIILGAIEPTIKGENVSEEVIQRQVRLMHTHTHTPLTMKHVLKVVELIVQKIKMKKLQESFFTLCHAESDTASQ